MGCFADQRGHGAISTHPDLPTTMRAALLTGHGGPEVLQGRTDVPLPKHAVDEPNVALSLEPQSSVTRKTPDDANRIYHRRVRPRRQLPS